MPRFLASGCLFRNLPRCRRDGVDIESNFSERFQRFPRSAHCAIFNATRSNDKPVVVKALRGNRRRATRGTLSLQMRAVPI